MPESEPPKKKQNKKSSKKGEKEEDDDIDGEGEPAEEKEDGAVGEETKAREHVELKDKEDVGEKDTEPTTEEKVDDMDFDKIENEKEAVKQQKEPETSGKSDNNQEAANKTTDDAKEEKIKGDLLLTPATKENKEEASKLPLEPEAQTLQPVPSEADGKVENESEAVKEGKEASTKNLISTTETKANNDDVQESVDGPMPMDNHTVSCEKTSHEPKASQVNC